MCGITGAIIKSENHKYWDLLRVSEIRGQDGTGIVWSKKNDSNLKVLRSNNKASVMLESELPILSEGDIIIGQNRLAVFGQDHKNDQPLIGDKYSLVHNGNLFNFESVFEKFNLKRELQVDTELILRFIEFYNTLDIQNSIKKTMETIQGNYACLLLNPEARELWSFAYLKPLFYFEDETGKYFFSTERIGQKVFGKDKRFISIQNKAIVKEKY